MEIFGSEQMAVDLNLFDPKQNTFKHYKYNPVDSKTIGSNEVLDITEDSEEIYG